MHIPGRSLTHLLLVALAALTVLGQEPAPQTTPPQRFFEWTRMPFAKALYETRRENLRTSLSASGGGVFLTPSRPGRSGGETFRQTDDFFYFTGLELPDSILAVDTEHKHSVLFVPDDDARFASPTRPNDFPGRPLGRDPELSRVSGLSDVRPIEAFETALQGWIREGRLLRLNPGRGETELATSFFYNWSVEQRFLHHLRQTYPAAKVRTAFPEVARLRMVKSPEEVATIRRAVEITAAGIRRASATIAPGVDERTLEAEFEAETKRRGAQRLAFASIIKSGPNSLWPWRILAAQYDRRNRTMRPGELVIFDVGCELDHYASDVGRTFPVSGKFTAEQRRTLERVTRTADAILAAIRPGKTFAELTDVAVASIPESERKYSQTGLYFGHHIGLDVGDPSLENEKLLPGMVFTVEPWYYNHDRGISVFVEDVVLVTAEGHENLSRRLPRSPDGLEQLMNSVP